MIHKQTHIENEFGENNNIYFDASNGVRLLSISQPEVRGETITNDDGTKFKVYMRGYEDYSDFKVLEFGTAELLANFITAVTEYNIKFDEINIECKCKDAILCEECKKDPKKAVEF